MTVRLFTLADDDSTPVPCADPIAWARWMASPSDHRYHRESMTGNVTVTTYFIGATMEESERPSLFETVASGGPHDGCISTSCTGSEAEADHEHMCKLAFGDRYHQYRAIEASMQRMNEIALRFLSGQSSPEDIAAFNEQHPDA